MEKPTIAIASDHAGFEQKEKLKAWLTQQGYQVHDLGPANDDRVDYPDFAALVASALTEGSAQRGVLVCGTGIGMAIAANKFPGIRAANVTSAKFASLAREHNDANVITISGRFVTPEDNKEILSNFLTTPFGKGRHAARLEKIALIEQARDTQA